jgi:hypothetical protein
MPVASGETNSGMTSRAMSRFAASSRLLKGHNGSHPEGGDNPTNAQSVDLSYAAYTQEGSAFFNPASAVLGKQQR